MDHVLLVLREGNLQYMIHMNVFHFIFCTLFVSHLAVHISPNIS